MLITTSTPPDPGWLEDMLKVVRGLIAAGVDGATAAETAFKLVERGQIATYGRALVTPALDADQSLAQQAATPTATWPPAGVGLSAHYGATIFQGGEQAQIATLRGGPNFQGTSATATTKSTAFDDLFGVVHRPGPVVEALRAMTQTRATTPDNIAQQFVEDSWFGALRYTVLALRHSAERFEGNWYNWPEMGLQPLSPQQCAEAILEIDVAARQAQVPIKAFAELFDVARYAELAALIFSTVSMAFQTAVVDALTKLRPADAEDVQDDQDDQNDQDDKFSTLENGVELE